MDNKLNIVIITGMSGAGKTVAIQSFEDMGYFTVDNMPPNLIEKFVGLLNTPDNKIDKVALVVDMRSRAFFEDIQSIVTEPGVPQHEGYKCILLPFLCGSRD